MKKVVLVNQTAGFLMVDVVNAFVNSYDKVILLAGTVNPMCRQLSPTVVIDKICPYDRSTSFNRIKTWLAGYWQIKRKIKYKYKDYEVVYVSNPPMSYFVALRTSNPYSVVIYDIYPDALKNIGIKSSNPFYKLWSKWNIRIFANAKKVITLSEGMANVVSQYMPIENITVIPNWAGSDKFKPINKAQNEFAQKHNLRDKFLVMYSGNMGYTHSVEVLVDVAVKMIEDTNIHFLLVGNGQKRPIIEKRIVDLGLKNCTVLGWQPAEVLPESLACADVAVITLNEESAAVSVPSKTYNWLAVGAPLLCVCPPDSEMARIVETYKNGKCFRVDQVDEMAAFIRQLATDKTLALELSDNSLKASVHFSYHNAEKYV